MSIAKFNVFLRKNQKMSLKYCFPIILHRVNNTQLVKCFHALRSYSSKYTITYNDNCTSKAPTTASLCTHFSIIIKTAVTGADQ